MGVERSSWAGVLARGVVPTLLRTVRAAGALLAGATEDARRGVTGVFAVRVLANVGFKGRPVLEFRRSGTGMIHGQRWLWVCVIGQYDVFARRACSRRRQCVASRGWVGRLAVCCPTTHELASLGGRETAAPRVRRPLMVLESRSTRTGEGP